MFIFVNGHRYILRMSIYDGENLARVTLFENAEILLVCSVNAYKQCIEVY